MGNCVARKSLWHLQPPSPPQSVISIQRAHLFINVVNGRTELIITDICLLKTLSEKEHGGTASLQCSSRSRRRCLGLIGKTEALSASLAND